MGSCIPKSARRTLATLKEENAKSITTCSSEIQIESGEETIKSNELHYATIDFGFTESMKDKSADQNTTPCTTYATIKTNNEDNDAYDYVLVQ
ncbi:Hypothetical predicted protein [Pelobates cultripes]|uniref:Uncharacterized protein n=1 Tax=Pelobates cultripes TaxID=61616 RepID=A0AAD1VJB0_PELCU|nr:Hypothetical predicted protein [Pelobates cultripes]